jgi:hypothetical protein
MRIPQWPCVFARAAKRFRSAVFDKCHVRLIGSVSILVLVSLHLIDRFSTHHSLMTQPRYMAGMQFALDARRQCQLDQPVFRLYIIQTLALLALHAFSINQGSHAWFYLGTPPIISL